MMSLDFSRRPRRASGPVAQISCGRYMPAAWPEAVSLPAAGALQVCCEHGVAFVDLPSHAGLVRRGRAAPGVAGERAAGGRADCSPSSTEP